MAIPTAYNALSYVPLRVEARYQSEPLGVATGFLYKGSERSHFITNWHVVTGRHADTGEPLLRETAALPDSLVIWAPFRRMEDGQGYLSWRQFRLPLYEDAERRKPAWFEHPIHGGKVDVAAIEIGNLGELENLRAIAANDKESLQLTPAALYPSLTVFVLGYPLGLTGGLHFPIYKRASIANEHEFPPGGMPMFYIDTATRKGMSGAPVFVDEMGTWLSEEPGGARVIQHTGRGRRFVGVYAARDGQSTEFEAQLGIVWKVEAIDEIIAGRKSGVSPFWPELEAD